MSLIASVKKASQWGAFFVLTFISLAVWSAETLCPSPAPMKDVRVARVVDGDTLRLRDGRRVRLIGINAPELDQAGRPAEPYAVQAKRRLERLVEANDGRLRLVVGKETHHHDRQLAHLFDRDGNNVEAMLLSEGLGYAVADWPNTLLTECQFQAELGAKKKRLGVWKESPVLTADQVTQSGFAFIQGKIQTVERNGGGLWLELDGPVVLNIRREYLSAFDEKEMKALRGARVEARGWLIDRSERGALRPGMARWILLLTSPHMLEPLP